MAARAREHPKERYAALVVAAGGATRMGSPKALLPWGHASLLRHVVATALASRCSRVDVVVGADPEALERELLGLDASTVEHPGWREGIGSSIAVGVDAIAGSDDVDGVVLLLCDQPFVTPALIDALIAEREIADAPMAACRYAGTLGPPAVFGRALFGALRELSGDRGAKGLLLADPSRVVAVDFPEGEFDIDTPDDYDRALERWKRAPGDRARGRASRSDSS